ncbi:MAG: hypothetical protein J7L38_02295 [Thermoproteales archaeon]|nr:hypothetical protein [Thermoproteales archaeon]
MLSLLLTLSLAYVKGRVLLVDMGGAARKMLATLEPPYLSDVMINRVSWREAVLEVEVESTVFHLIPRGHRIEQLRLEWLDEAKSYFENILIDMPAYQSPIFDKVIDSSDVCILVAEPGAVSEVVSSYRGESYLIVVLNKYKPHFIEDKIYLENTFGEENVYVLPFDPALSCLNPRYFTQALSYVSKDFMKSFKRLLSRMLNPYER